MVSLCIPLFIGMLLNVAIVSFSPMMRLEGTDWLKVGLVGCASVVYISAFVFLGLLVSARCARSSTSLVILLLIWVVWSVIGPNTGGLLAGQLRPIPPAEEIERRVAAAWDDVHAAYRKKYGNEVGSFYGDPERDKWSILAQKEARATQAKIRKDYARSKAAQVAFAKNVVRLSPTAVYQYAAETIAGTGLRHYERWMKQAEEYQRQFEQFIVAEDAKDETSKHVIGAVGDTYMSRKGVELKQVPVFVEQPAPVKEALEAALLDLLLLFVFNVVLFMLAYAGFLRADVR